MKLDRVMIAAPKSGSGKTTITCALLQSLKEQGIPVVSYKCGPDYIDPMFHKEVLGVPSKNLDTFFTGEEETRALLTAGRTEGELAVLEGVMGLYDGLGGIREEGSSYHLAKVTGTPIVLVVDAKGMGKSVLALIAGFLQYDTEKLIRGVILNWMSGAYFQTIKPLIEKELSVSAVGYVPDQKHLELKSRHLGLVLPKEQEEVQEQIRDFAAELQKTVSIEKIREIAAEAVELPEMSKGDSGLRDHLEGSTEEKHVHIESVTDSIIESSARDRTEAREMTDNGNDTDSPLIAVAWDEAFCFYYEDNLRLLEEQGARLRYFSPLHDSRLPEGCDGILLGGGYPELHLQELEQNGSMRNEIRDAMERGIPCVAECGGFMYLQEAIEDQEGQQYRMAGVIPGICINKGKLVRFGYIELQEKKPSFLPEGTKIRGHEFHYYDSSDNGEDCMAVKPVTGKSYPCVIETQNRFLGFPHLYYPSNPGFAENFVEKARDFRNRNQYRNQNRNQNRNRDRKR